jgi:hypothetical protein
MGNRPEGLTRKVEIEEEEEDDEEEEEIKEELPDQHIAITHIIYKWKGKREKPGNYRVSSLPSVRGAVPRIFWNPGRRLRNNLINQNLIVAQLV